MTSTLRVGAIWMGSVRALMVGALCVLMVEQPVLARASGDEEVCGGEGWADLETKSGRCMF